MKNLIKIVICSILISFPIIFSKAISTGIKNGIEISLSLAIPSIFCFMVICDILYKSGLINTLISPLNKILCALYNLDKDLIGVVVLSQIGGFPIGAKLISDLVKSEKLDKTCAENMLCYCVNCGPAFLIGGVGIVLFRSIKIGLIIFICELFASIFCGFLNRKSMQSKTRLFKDNCKKDYANIIVTSTSSCVKAMSMICAFIILFCAFTQIIQNLNISPTIKSIICGFVEVTQGCYNLCELSFYQKLILSVLFTSFGGLCVHIQIASIISGSEIKLKKFYLYRIVYTLISTGLAILATKFIDIPIEVFNSYIKITPQISTNSYISSIFLIFLSIGLLLSCKKSAKI